MKLINLNLQCGAKYDSLIEFLKKQSSEIDVFCFQEVTNHLGAIRPVLKNARPDLFSDLQKILPDFNGHYAVLDRESDVGGLSVFIRKSFVVNKIENIVILSEFPLVVDLNDSNFFTMGRNVQCMEFNHEGKTYTIFNFHGMWIPNNKKDTDKRIEQSKAVRRIFNESKKAKILCGDLNIEPETKSLDILTESNINLVKKYDIISTRSLSKGRQEVADYIIVSPDIKIKNFAVPNIEVSDHLPLILEFK